jgi:hypothetical protein
MKKLLLTMLFTKVVLAVPSNCAPISPDTARLIVTGEVALATMTGLISRLGTNSIPGLCVPVLPTDPTQLALCSSMIDSYAAAVVTISVPCTVDMSLEPSYLVNPYDPCKFVVSGMVGAGAFCPLSAFKPY